MANNFSDRFFLVRLARDEKKIRIAILGLTLLVLLLLANSFYLTIQSLKKEKVLPNALPLTSPSPIINITQAPTVIPTAVQQNFQTMQPAVKEFFIPFGAGTSNASDWTDVPGLTANINFGNYSSIKEVHFEASISIPTANQSASVRLFNVTDKHPVWYSEITLTDGQFVSSNPIIYDVGNKIYQVQMKTSLQFTANLIQSRIHIVLQ